MSKSPFQSPMVVALVAVVAVIASMTAAALASRPTAAPPPIASLDGPTQDEVIARVRRLEARLQEQPDDADGWKMLGRSYMALGEYAAATGAFSKAKNLLPRDAEVAAALQRLTEIARTGGRHDRAMQAR